MTSLTQCPNTGGCVFFQFNRILLRANSAPKAIELTCARVRRVLRVTPNITTKGHGFRVIPQVLENKSNTHFQKSCNFEQVQNICIKEAGSCLQRSQGRVKIFSNFAQSGFGPMKSMYHSELCYYVPETNR